MGSQEAPKCRFHTSTPCIQMVFGYKLNSQGKQVQRKFWVCPLCQSYHGGVKDGDEDEHRIRKFAAAFITKQSGEETENDNSKS